MEEIEIFPTLEIPGLGEFLAISHEKLQEAGIDLMGVNAFIFDEDRAILTSDDAWESFLQPYQFTEWTLKTSTGAELCRLRYGFLSDEYPMGLYGSANLYGKLEDLAKSMAKYHPEADAEAHIDQIKQADWYFEIVFEPENERGFSAAQVLGRIFSTESKAIIQDSRGGNPNIYLPDEFAFSH